MARNPDKKRCKAKSKRTGEQCKNWAVRGYEVCYFHGAGGRPKIKPPPGGGRAPKGNQNARKHGAYTTKLLPAEQEEHKNLVKLFSDSLGSMDAFDEVLVDLLALYLTKVHSCTAAGAPAEAVAPWAKLAVEHMRELKATRASREPKQLVVGSPAQFAGDLLARIKERKPELLEHVTYGNGNTSDSEVIDAEYEVHDEK